MRNSKKGDEKERSLTLFCTAGRKKGGQDSAVQCSAVSLGTNISSGCEIVKKGGEKVRSLTLFWTKVRKYIKYVQRNTAEPLGTFQVGFGVDLADTYSGAQGERLFSRAPDSTKIFQPRVQTVYTAILLKSSGK
jgi:hypothetical protein